MSSPALEGQSVHRWWKETWLWGMLSLVLFIHGARVFDQPIRGEESRWARGGVEMLESGNWIVPTQQLTVFPERPPLNSWTMALASVVFGEMNSLAVRLPSLISTLLTCVILYAYLRRWLPSAGAAVIASVFATMGQVLQLGHLGESEAMLTMLIAASLLGWHAAWLDDRPTKAWLIGFSAAALAALTKGLQGPVYFIAVTTIYLVTQQGWKALTIFISPRWWLGLISMVAIVASWALPFWLQTDTQAVKDVWTGLVADRVSWQGLLEHLALYPLEILACWLPWSLFLIPLCQKRTREAMGPYHVPLVFALVALMVTFPSVWLVTGARGRYFMPLAPMAAVVLGIVVWTTLAAIEVPKLSRHWLRFAKALSVGGIVGSILVLTTYLFGTRLIPAYDSASVWTVCMVMAALSVLVGIEARRTEALLTTPIASDGAVQQYSTRWPVTSFIGTLLLLGWANNFIVISNDLEHGDFVNEEVTQAKAQLDDSATLVSLGPVHHRFAFHWQTQIPMRPWPNEANLEPDFDYFAIDFQSLDTPQTRIAGRGRSWTTTSGTLPFQWEVVRAIPIDREYRESRNWVLVCRVLRDESGQSIARSQSIPSFDSIRR